MATLESMAIRSNAALDRIENKLMELGVLDTPMTSDGNPIIPRLMREREMLRAVQLEQIATLLEQVEFPEPVTVIQPPVTAKGKPNGTKRR